MVRDLSAAIGLDQIDVTRQYRLKLNEPSDAACYLQGVNEATHGIADSLLSVLGNRAGDIAGDLLARRAGKKTNGAHRTVEELTSVPLSADGALQS
jgi:L-ornithine N5-oxygenase